MQQIKITQKFYSLLNQQEMFMPADSLIPEAF